MIFHDPLKLRNLSLPVLRKFFADRNLAEVITPLLVRSGGIEPYVDPVVLPGEFFLPTSPEISLKKTLALDLYFGQNGAEGIYEIAHAFRNDISGSLHLTEFTMVEWYKKNCNYMDFAEEVSGLMRQIAGIYPDKAVASDALDFHIMSVSDVFAQIFKAEIDPAWAYDDFANLSRAHAASTYYSQNSNNQDIIELFSVLYDEAMRKIIRTHPGLLFIRDYPPFLRGMAKLSPEGWAMRMEGFFSGIELCSGYQELDDAAELERIWHMNNEIRASLGKPLHPVDRDLLELNSAMNGVSGMALGLERTLMVVFGLNNIQDFRLQRFS